MTPTIWFWGSADCSWAFDKHALADLVHNSAGCIAYTAKSMPNHLAGVSQITVTPTCTATLHSMQVAIVQRHATPTYAPNLNHAMATQWTYLVNDANHCATARIPHRPLCHSCLPASSTRSTTPTSAPHIIDTTSTPCAMAACLPH